MHWGVIILIECENNQITQNLKDCINMLILKKPLKIFYDFFNSFNSMQIALIFLPIFFVEHLTWRTHWTRNRILDTHNFFFFYFTLRAKSYFFETI
jgi:hypothetical protein